MELNFFAVFTELYWSLAKVILLIAVTKLLIIIVNTRWLTENLVKLLHEPRYFINVFSIENQKIVFILRPFQAKIT